MHDEDVLIPEYFEANDVRKPVDKYVKDHLTDIIKELFESRRSLEKYMSRQELTKYDSILAGYLEYDALLPKLK